MGSNYSPTCGLCRRNIRHFHAADSDIEWCWKKNIDEWEREFKTQQWLPVDAILTLFPE